MSDGPQQSSAGRTAVVGAGAEAGPEETVQPTVEAAGAELELVLEDLLVEDVSIDGMCGVY